MKKTKPEKQPAPVSTPVSMSSKKIGALKHEMLFTPYKI
jgi:hypothetical protein